jgi:hypothetical protein
MYMRYAGGGVGHYRVTLMDTPANANEIREDFAVDDNVTADPPRLTNLELEERIIVAESAGQEEVEEAERIQDDNIEDHCSDSEGEEDEEENPDEDDYLGAEDGEGGFVDAEDDEGYAAL